MAFNPIERAIYEIKFAIPREILNEVFKPEVFSWSPAAASIDEQILNKVIRPKVFIDANIVGGTEVLIPTHTLPRQNYDEFTSVFHIPKSLTQGRSILAVLSMTYMDSSSMAAFAQNAANTLYKPCSINDLNTAAQALMNSVKTTTTPSTAKVELIAENTIMVRDSLKVISTGFLRCLLAYDDQMSQIQVGSILDFADLAVLATKAYIYNNYRVKLDQGQLAGGFEIGAFRDIVEGYSDAREQYQEFLRETWRKVAHMNDRESYERLIRMQIGGMR